MNLDKLKQRAIDYTTDRLCKGGGFCFYRLEEPSGSDTYYALSILNLLNVRFRDQKTDSYLKQMQHDDGAYDNIYAAFFSIQGLRLLNKQPHRDPIPYIFRVINEHHIDVEKLPAEVTSLFKRMSYLVELFLPYGSESTSRSRDNFIRFILRFRNSDDGFGNQRSTLTETTYALSMLHGLSYPIESLAAEMFIRKCEVARFGFTDIPGSSLSFIEYLSAGVTASQLTSYHPQNPEMLVDFIINCQNRNGGFSRAMHSGIATLENTYHAVRALIQLETMLEN